MKKLLIISLLMLGCGPKFKVGDCTISSRPIERWESKIKLIDKILEVGKEQYRYVFTAINGNLYQTDFYIDGYDRIKVKTECTKELNEYKEEK